jgi:hypothetical protein
MAKRPDYFDDLVLTPNDNNIVAGIEGGLAIKGHGTFKFQIEDNDGKIHLIKIPNSKYAPGLKYSLISPQHWAQEAKDHYPKCQGTRSELDDNHCILIWGQGKYRRSVPFSPMTNTPTFRLAPASYLYRAFIAVHEAMEAQQYRREHVVQIPDLYPRVDEEYIADENLFFDAEEHDKEMSVLEGARPDNETVLTSNLTSSSVNKNEDRHLERRGPLTFDPSPPLDDNHQVDLIAADKQSELMRWHHCLGHLSFAKIKALALAGEIPKKLAKVKPPVCAGCLYGAMTKVN